MSATPTSTVDVDPGLHAARASSGPQRSAARVVRIRWPWLIAVVVALALAVVWWMARRPATVKYVTAPITRGVVARTVSATGTVNPVLTIIVGSYVSGVVRDMHCDYNTRVKKGQVCAQIDPRPYKAALDEAKGQLARDTAQLEGAKLNLDRYAVLKDQDSIAKQTYDDQLALVRQLTGTVSLDRAAVETAEVNLGYTNIISPVDGTVVARNITIGQTVAASFQTPTLFLIATDLTQMQVDTNVSESDIGAVQVGNDASFTVEAFTDRPFRGKVVQVRQAPQTVQNVVTYDVVVAARNGEFLLKPGMTATVAVVTDRRSDVMRIPDQALRFTPSGIEPGVADGAPGAGGTEARGPRHQGRVWVMRQGEPSPISLTLGLDDDTFSEVIQGALTPGDQVIVGEQRAAEQRARPLRFGF